ncbi:hypothetical protein BC833DRAFT_658353 [Globomyces pollinis-pini]|nr:hypothetical protein BC833DRAFT_658353 [Globomyces pollinis-pini]
MDLKNLEEYYNEKIPNDESVNWIQSLNSLLESNQLAKLNLSKTGNTSTAVEYLLIGEKSEIKFGQETIQLALNAAAKLGDSIGVLNCHELLMKGGYKPTHETFAGMVTAFGNANDIENAQVWFDKYQDSDLGVHDSVLLALAKAMVRTGNVSTAVELVMEGFPALDYPVKISYFNSILEELVLTRQFDDAKELFELLNDSSDLPKMDNYTYQLGIVVHSFLNDFSSAWKIFNENFDLSKIDQFHFALGWFGRLCVQNQKFSEALKVFESAKGRDAPLFLELTLNSTNLDMEQIQFVIKTAIKGFNEIESFHSHSEKIVNRGIENIWKSVTELEKAIEFATIIQSLSSKHIKLNSKLWYLFQDLEGPLANMTLEKFTILFESAFSIPAAKKMSSKFVKDLLKLYDLMETQGLNVNITIHNVVFTGLKKEKNIIGALQWKERVLKSSTLTEEEVGIVDVGGGNVKNEIDYCVKANLLMDAISIFKDTINNERYPPLATLHLLLKQCGSLSEEDVKFIWKSTLSVGSRVYAQKPDEFTLLQGKFYDILLSTTVNMESPNVFAQVILEIMEQFNNVITEFDAAVQKLSKTPDPENLLKQLIDARQKIDPKYKPPMNLLLKSAQASTGNELENYSKQYETYKSYKLTPPSAIYVNLIRLHAEANDLTSAVQIFDDYLENSKGPIEADVIAYLMNIYIRDLQDMKSAIRLWKVAGQYKVKMNKDILALLLYGFAIVEQDMPKALKLANKSQGLVSTIHQEIILSGYSLNLPTQMKELVSHFRFLVETNNASKTCYDIMIDACARNGDVATAEDIYESMGANGFDPSTSTRNALLQGLTQSNFGKSLAFYEEQVKVEQVDMETYKIMLDAAVAHNRKDLIPTLLKTAKSLNIFSKEDLKSLEESFGV